MTGQFDLRGKRVFARTLLGPLNKFTGVGAPYERPIAPDLLDGATKRPVQGAKRIIDPLIERGQSRA